MLRSIILLQAVMASHAALRGSPSWKSICSGPVQTSLRFGLSDFPVPQTLPDPAPGETLGDAICCDSYYRNIAAAEPSGLFADAGVDLFATANENADGTFTFRDSVSGIPLFIAPRGRSLDDFKAETAKHGWPSFRDAEMVKNNVVVTKDGEVHSISGTHLGHNDPDSKGPRYCLDLVCLAGHSQKDENATVPIRDDNQDYIALATFDGAKASTHHFTTVNDPVMGGKSTSSFSVDKETKVGEWKGEVKIVPFLHAPGFCTMRTDDSDGAKFADLSGTDELKLGLQVGSTFAAGDLTSFEAQIETKGSKSGFRTGTYTGKFSVDATRTGPQLATVSWDSFKLTWRGQPMDGPALTDELDQITRIGLGAAGTAGKFDIAIISIGAGKKGASPAELFDFIAVPVPVPAAAAADLDSNSHSDSEAVQLVTFDGAKGTTFEFSVVNDPVMGGLSKSTFTVENKMAVFDGTVAIVPKLKAPGFCNAKSNLLKSWHLNHFNDASAYTHLVLVVRTTTPDFKGYKISFAADTLNPQFYSYKANFDVPAGDGDEWQTVKIPFSSFSNDWSAYTGDCDTTDPRGKVHHCCTKEHPEVCPTTKNLADISQIGFWTEGHAGDFHLEIQSVGAGNADAEVGVVAVAA